MTPPPLSRRSFLKASAALAVSGPILTPWRKARGADAQGPLIVYVGTYSNPVPIQRPGLDMPIGNGRGIHSFHVNRETGDLSPHGVFELATSPNSLALHPAGTHLYSANETHHLQENEPGSISSFAIDRSTGRLTLLNTVSSGGAGPAHLSVHPSGRFVLVANYFGGSIAVLPILADGHLGSASDFKQDTGRVGPKRATDAPPGSFADSGHDAPHAHMIEADPSGRFVISTDLGLDQILIWKFDDHAGLLSPNDPPFIALPPGDGPRHFAFHPNGGWLYSLQEESSTMVLFDYDSAAGRLARRQTISSLPPGFAGTSFSSEIMVSPDGRYVYAANRLRDTISIFSIGHTGVLTFAGEESTRGDYPRNFNIDPSGTFLYSCNQRSDAVTAFRIDRNSGGLTFTGQFAPVGSPSIIIFLDLGKAG